MTNRSLALLAVALVSSPALGQDAKFQTFSRTREGAKLGVVVDLRGLVENPAAGHTYVLRYQYRLHTTKGEDGPLLGDAAVPGGRSFDVAPMAKPSGLGWRLDNDFGGGPPPSGEDRARAERGVEFAGLVDVTRRELSGMTRLPQHASGVVVRVEPHIFDATARKYVTPTRTRGAAVVLETGYGRSPEEVLKADKILPTFLGSPIHGDKVKTIEPFADWFRRQFDTPARAEAALRVFDGLTDPDIMDEMDAFKAVLTAKDVPPAARALALRALPQRHNHIKSGFQNVVKLLAADPDAGVRAAAEAWLTAKK